MGRTLLNTETETAHPAKILKDHRAAQLPAKKDSAPTHFGCGSAAVRSFAAEIL
jgi:hypothetical protein